MRCGRASPVHECTVCRECQPEESGGIGRDAYAADHVCGTAFVGKHSQEQQCALGGDKRRDGARLGEYNKDISGLAGQFCHRQGQCNDTEDGAGVRQDDRVQSTDDRVQITEYRVQMADSR